MYDAEQEVEGKGGEMKVLIRSMEERRSVSARYSNVMNICWEKRRRELPEQSQTGHMEQKRG